MGMKSASWRMSWSGKKVPSLWWWTGGTAMRLMLCLEWESVQHHPQPFYIPKSRTLARTDLVKVFLRMGLDSKNRRQKCTGFTIPEPSIRTWTYEPKTSLQELSCSLGKAGCRSEHFATAQLLHEQMKDPELLAKCSFFESQL